MREEDDIPEITRICCSMERGRASSEGQTVTGTLSTWAEEERAWLRKRKKEKFDDERRYGREEKEEENEGELR